MLETAREIGLPNEANFQTVLDEALSDWVEPKAGNTPRPETVAHLEASISHHRVVCGANVERF